MKSRRYLIFLFIYLMALSHSSYAFDIAKLDSLLHLLADKNKAMVSLVIDGPEGESYANATGFSAKKDGQPLPSTTDTRYRIGSVTKMFTATMIMQLVEEGKLDLTYTLDQYFPGIPNAQKINMLHLLQHKSGIYNFTDEKSYINWLDQAKTRDEILAIIAQHQPAFIPGETSSYSNSNYVLLGYIIEDISGMSYHEALQERIVKRANLVNTYIGGATDISQNESYSYNWMINWLQHPETDLSIPGGAGAIVSTPSDMVMFAEALFSGQLISESSIAAMTDVEDGFGLGLIKFPFYEKTAYGHTGGIDGFQSMLAYFPDEKVAVALCSNGIAFPMNDILIGILSIYFDKPYNLPGFENIEHSPETLEKYTGVYSGQQLPIKITVGINNNSLFAQATGQSAFPLTATQNDIFTFEAAGIVMEFNTEKQEMILKQGGGAYLFVREED